MNNPENLIGKRITIRYPLTQTYWNHYSFAVVKRPLEEEERWVTCTVQEEFMKDRFTVKADDNPHGFFCCSLTREEVLGILRKKVTSLTTPPIP